MILFSEKTGVLAQNQDGAGKVFGTYRTVSVIYASFPVSRGLLNTMERVF